MPIDLNSGAPDDAHEIVEDEDERIADQELHQDVSAIDALHEEALDEDAEQTGADCSAKQRQRVAAGCLEHRHREIGADHVEGAVREVHDLHHAKDEGQPDRDQEQQHSDDEAAGRLRHQAGSRNQAFGQGVEIHHALVDRGTFRPRANAACLMREGNLRSSPRPSRAQAKPLDFFHSASSSKMRCHGTLFISGT